MPGSSPNRRQEILCRSRRVFIRYALDEAISFMHEFGFSAGSKPVLAMVGAVTLVVVAWGATAGML